MPTIYVQMSKRCAIGYAACQACADKAVAKGMATLPDHPLTMRAVAGMKKLGKWPPKCAYCGGPYPYAIELEEDVPVQTQIKIVQEGLGL